MIHRLVSNKNRFDDNKKYFSHSVRQPGKVAQVLQKKSTNGGEKKPDNNVSPKSQTAIPQELRTSLEHLSGFDLSAVNVNYNSTEPAKVNSLAYTQGNQIYLGAGQEKHLPHEVWHVVQQCQGRVKPNSTVHGKALSDDRNLEQEADNIETKLQAIKPEVNNATQSESSTNQPLQKPAFNTTMSPLQRKFNLKEALKYYKNTKAGRRIKYTPGLVEELYKVTGTSGASLRKSALAEAKIGKSFVLLVSAAQRALGVDDDGKIGTITIAAWDKWKTGGKKGIDYRQLFKDKKLEIGVAVGAERFARVGKIDKFLMARKFVKSGAKFNAIYKKKKKFPVQGDRTAAPVEIEIIIEMMSEKTTSPKDKFGNYLTKKEITFYSGHARYGTGPDFDAKKSPAENFVIGVNSALHKRGKLKKGYNAAMNKVLQKRKNDLEQLSKAGKFNAKQYQVWFLDACSTINYLDEIRGGLVKGKDRKNLRVFGTRDLVWGDPLPILKGILEMKTMEEIIIMKQKSQEKLKASYGVKSKKNLFFAD